MANHSNDIERLLSRMTLEEKVGGTLIVDWVGTVLTPEAFRMIREVQVAGFRVDTSLRGKPSYAEETGDAVQKERLARSSRPPSGGMKDFRLSCHAPYGSVEAYAQALELLREASRERPSGIPVHFVLDQEGNGSENFTLGDDLPLWPCPMGLSATGNAELVRESARALGGRLREAGIDWIHSPVLDVNTNPDNPEIGTRSYGTDPDTVRTYADASHRGFHEAGIITTGKHFPGRGASNVDSHVDLPVIDLDEKTLRDEHLEPFAALIRAGIPAIMMAHTLYPAFDADHPATVSSAIITDVLKKELQFAGAVTTDNMLMGGIVSRYGVPEASLRAIQAGVDLLLIRSETGLCDEVFETLLQAARRGEIPEDRLDDANRRVLTLKARYGILPGEDHAHGRSPGTPAQMYSNAQQYALEKQVAEAAIEVRGKLRPLERKTRVLVIEQVHATHTTLNTLRCHPSVFWRRMLDVFPQAMNCEITEADAEDYERVLRRVKTADAVVITNWVARRSNSDIADFVRRVRREAGTKPFVVVTNSPFRFGSPEDFDPLINLYSANPESLAAAAAVLVTGVSGREGARDQP